MSTWFASPFPFQISALMLVVGIMMLGLDRERMLRARLSSEARFVHYAAWFYIVASVASVLLGGLM